MRTKECPACDADARLTDAGFDLEAETYYRQWKCRNGHEHAERFPRDAEPIEGAGTGHDDDDGGGGRPDSDLGTVRRLNRLLDRLGVGA